jgi:twitching motility protein PilT
LRCRRGSGRCRQAEEPDLKAIGSLLQILLQQDGTELRLASGRRPRMFKEGVELPLTIPAMSTDHVRELLGDLWTSHEAALHRQGQVSLAYDGAELGKFDVTLAQRDGSDLEVCFRRRREGIGNPDRSTSGKGSAGDSVRSAGETGALPAALAALLARAVSRGASDLHLSPQGPTIARINGRLEVFEGGSGFDVAALLGGRDRLEEVRAGGSVDRALDVPALGRVRINVYATTAGLCAAVRILKKEAPTLAELNLPPHLEPLVDLPHGLVLACGPTGCGKSTTLAALIQHAMQARAQVLVTLEDPIEYVIRPMRASGLVRQREVGTHVRGFASGLRDALREDPDILLIGEMRDPETISLALTAAETGHLVFASLHSRTAASTIERMVDTYPPERQRQIRVQIADSLRAVISQRLVPAADGAGRVPAVELLRVNYAVANLIREGRTAQIVSALQGGGNEGMLVLERHLADLVRANRITRETAMAVANDSATLAEYLRAGGTSADDPQ